MKKAILFFLLLILLSLILFRLTTRGNESFIFRGIGIYFDLAQKFWNGHIPYLDFYFEYPPLSIILFILPLFFTKYFVFYIFTFSFMNLICVFLIFLISNSFLKFLGFKKNKIEKIFIFEFVFFILFFQFFIIVYDIYPVFFVLLGLYFYIIYLRKDKGIFNTLAYLFILTGGFLKLYPLLLLPLLLITDLQRKKYRLLVQTIVINFLFFLPHIIFLFYARNGLVYFLNYHSQRGLQIESVYSSIVFFLEKINVINNFVIKDDFGSLNIYGVLPDFLAQISFYLFFIFYFLFLFFFFRSKKENDLPGKIIISAVVIVLIFILFNKVFSPQYILWLFPFFFFVDFSLLNLKNRIYKFFLLIVFISNLIYPYLYKIGFDYTVSCFLVLVRNLLLFVLLYKILFLFKKKYLS